MTRRLAGVALLASAAAAAVAVPATAAFPGRNGLVAFERTVGNDAEIFTIRPDGTHQRRLTDNAIGDNSPRFTPDGRRIVFETCRGGHCGVFVMKRSGKHARRLEYVPSDATEPAVAKHRIAFVGGLDGRLYVATTDDRGNHRVRRLTSKPAGAPEFSPDGHQILYVDLSPPTWGNFVVVDVDGRHRRRLTHFKEASSPTTGEPTFSPDGRQIAFWRVSRVNGQCCTRDIWVMPLGGAARRLTNGQFIDNAVAPAFSPDGRRIVYARVGVGPTEVNVVDVATGRERRLASTPYSEGTYPDWQRLPLATARLHQR